VSSQSVLVVHADEDVSASIQAVLESEGLHVRLASDGLEGLAAVEQESPALIITDTMLPRLDGVSLINAVQNRADTCETPVIIVSGRVESDAILTGFAAGARYYVTLPFNSDDLRAKIRRLLNP